MAISKFSQFLVVAAVLNTVLWGCSLPETSRTAAIHDVKIEDGVSPDNLLVQPGDEVRWVNLRKMNVVIDIPTLKSEDLACHRGFTNWLGVLRETADLKPNETAALCFKKPVVVNYNVRSETALAGGKHIVPAVVKVGQTTDQNAGRTSGQSGDPSSARPGGQPSNPASTPSGTTSTTTTTTTTVIPDK